MSNQTDRKYRMAKYRHENIRKNVVKGLRQLGYDVEDYVFLSSFITTQYGDYNMHYDIYTGDREARIGELVVERTYRETMKFDDFTLVKVGEDKFNLKLLTVGEETLVTI